MLGFYLDCFLLQRSKRGMQQQEANRSFFLQLPKALEAEESEDCAETPEVKQKHCRQMVNTFLLHLLILGTNLITNLTSRKMKLVLLCCAAMVCPFTGTAVTANFGLTLLIAENT